MGVHAGAVYSSDEAHENQYAGLVSSRPWYRNKRLVILNAWIALLLITSSTNGFDGSMVNGLQSLTQWNASFGTPSGGKLGLLSAIQNVGSLTGLAFAPYVTDAYGRRISIFVGAFLMIVGASLQSASQSVEMFIGARFLIGFGLTFATSAAPLLVIELAYPTQRGQLSSLYNAMWFTGSIVAAWSTYGTFHLASSWAWRIPSALQGTPSILQFLLIWLVPESPRWLISKGRRAEALRTLAYYHANGNEEDPLVEYEFEEIKAAIVVERVMTANIGWQSMWKTTGNRRRLRVIIGIAFFSQWSGNGLISYYLAKVLDGIGIQNSEHQLLISGFLSIFQFVLAVIAGLLCEKIGRRPLFIASTSIMLAFWTLLTIGVALYAQYGHHSAAYAVVAFICECAFIAFTPLIISYTLEILPFALRARGFALFNFAISLSIIFNQYINPILLEKLSWRYYLIYIGWLLFELFFVWRYVVETKDRTLEETAALFDGDDAVNEISYRASVHAGIQRPTTIGVGFEMNTGADTEKTSRSSKFGGGRRASTKSSSADTDIMSDTTLNNSPVSEMPKVHFLS
ncbi:hypothetical protein SISNIDRAFT_415529 [Sistotremastrum niveocremeum HHB9708]|uniref:Major facilitator superfamily (MFS) profile domain-containing protein n=1 Tax=Sistotremastrum niveocremeum HHB9708 TaxID=1314777 RepID=A0A164R9K9_9AGAM|nr:hypothetical protein SISNIDRAFT_415529 [Sistotremastrum niveocremeum HHB9708]